MLTPSLVLGGILLPAVLCGLTLGFAGRLWRANAEAGAAWAGPLAVGLGFLAAFIAISGVGALPGEERTLTGLDWTFWGSSMVAALATLRAFLSAEHRPRAAAIARVTLLALSPWFLARVLGNSAEAGGMVLIACLFLWLLLELGAKALVDARPGAAAPMVFWTVATGLAIVSGLSGSAKLGQLAGGLAACLGAVCVLAWWRPRLSLGSGGASVVVFALVALGLNAHFYSYTTRADLLLLASGLLTPLALWLPRLRELDGARRAALALGLALLPVAVAVARAALAFEPDPYAGY